MYDEIPDGIQKFSLYGKQFGGVGNSIYNRLRKVFVIDGILKKYPKATWYINTIVLPDILEFAAEHNITTILHTHELQQMYKGLNAEQLKRLIEHPTLIIANSKASASVVNDIGRKDKIEIVHPALSSRLINKTLFEDIRSQLKIAKDAFVWVMCGTLDPNKDPFLFIEIASELKKQSSAFKMIWIGGKVDLSDIDKKCEELVKERGLIDNVMFVGDVKERFYDHFAMANGFVLTSQFESFSMTTLEALYLQLPIVANDCVGVREILGSEFGYIVKKKSNSQEFAERMLEIMKAPDMVNKKGLRDRALTFGIKTIAQKWSDLINKTI